MAPFPDAFEPRKNYKRAGGPRPWSWLLLIPLGAVAAIGAATLDPRAIRAFVDQQLLHFQPAPSAEVPSLLPGPFRPGSRTATPSASAPGATPIEVPPAPSPPAPPSTQAADVPASAPLSPAPATDAPRAAAETPSAAVETPPAAAPAPVTDAPAPTVSTPAPVAAPPVAPQTEAQVPPAGPAELRFTSITISYRRGAGSAQAEARRLAARLESAAKTVELRAVATTMRSPVLTYYNQADKDEANALARSLAGIGGVWIVRPGPTRAAGSVELSLP